MFQASKCLSYSYFILNVRIVMFVYFLDISMYT